MTDAMPPVRLDRSFFARDVHVVAHDLIGRVVASGPCRARLVEVEAYTGADDPGSHAARGRTPRNGLMFGPPGVLYVYFTYGMHWCANVVTGDVGDPQAVLVRSAVPLEGIEVMQARRPAGTKVRDLCRGPARFCQAFGLDGAANGAEVTGPDALVWFEDDGTASPPVASGTRIGLSAGGERPWRYGVAGDPHLSRPL